MNRLVFLLALAITLPEVLSTPASYEERDVGSPTSRDRDVSLQAAFQGTRKRLTTREAVTLALIRRGWWGDAWDHVKEGAKKVGDKIKAGAEKVKEGWQKFKNGTKAAWETFKDHVGRDASLDEIYTDKRWTDAAVNAERRSSTRNDLASEAAFQGTRKRLTTREAVALSLLRRGWWGDAWDHVKEGAKKVGNKIKAGAEKVKEKWQKFEDGTKAAWGTFKDKAGRDASLEETYTDKRWTDSAVNAERRSSTQDDLARGDRETTAQKRVISSEWPWTFKGGKWPFGQSPPIYSR